MTGECQRREITARVFSTWNKHTWIPYSAKFASRGSCMLHYSRASKSSKQWL